MGRLCQKWQPCSKREPTGKDGSQPRQLGIALKIKNEICVGMVKTNIFILSCSPTRKLHSDPISHSSDNQPCPAGQCGGHQPGSYKSIPCHCLSDSRPAKPAAPEETLTRATQMPGSSLVPLVYFSKSKQDLSLCFKATPTLFWISWVHLTQNQKLDYLVTSLTQ